MRPVLYSNTTESSPLSESHAEELSRNYRRFLYRILNDSIQIKTGSVTSELTSEPTPEVLRHHKSASLAPTNIPPISRSEGSRIYITPSTTMCCLCEKLQPVGNRIRLCHRSRGVNEIKRLFTDSAAGSTGRCLVCHLIV